MGYTKDAIKGISWLGFFRIATRGMSYIRIAILARILTPAEYGAADIALLVLAITEVFTETGINIYLIQQKENIDRYINTAWVISIVRGILIAAIIWLTAPFITEFFHTPSVLHLLQLVAVAALLRGLINPSIVKFIKDLHFKKEFYYRTTIFFIEAIVSVIFAYLWQSPAAIIMGIIVGAFFEIILSFILARPIPIPEFKFSLFKNIVKHGKWLTATGIFNYIYHNGDNIVVGRLLNASALGLYQRAYSISMLPITEVTDVIGKVTFAVYTKMSDDRERLRRAYIRTMLTICSIVIPVGIIFFIFPEVIIKIILGDQWLSAAPVLKVLAVFGVIRAISTSSFAPFYALKKQKLVTHITFVSLVGLAITIVPFIQTWGLVGAAYSALFGSVVALPLTGYYLHKIFYRYNV